MYESMVVMPSVRSRARCVRGSLRRKHHVLRILITQFTTQEKSCLRAAPHISVCFVSKYLVLDDEHVRFLLLLYYLFRPNWMTGWDAVFEPHEGKGLICMSGGVLVLRGQR